MPIRAGWARSATRAFFAIWLIIAFAGPIAGETPPAPNAPSNAALDAIRTTLDVARTTIEEVEQTLKSEVLEETLIEIKRRLTPQRLELHGTIATLESDLNEVVSHRKQLGDPPDSADTPEDPNIVAERERLTEEQGEIESTLKNAHYLATRTDDLTNKVNDLRRGLFTRELLARSVGLFSPSLWRDVSEAVPTELGRVGQLLRAWWISAKDAPKSTWIGVVITLVGLAFAAFFVLRWWHRRLADQVPATRFQRAFQAVLVMLGDAITMPLALTVFVLVLENYGLMPSWIRTIGVGAATAVATATAGRGVANALFAPGRPQWRLIGWSDEEAARLSSHLIWAARALGLAIFLNLIHKTTAAPFALTVMTSALLALAVAAIGAHLLWRTTAGSAPAGAAEPGQRGLRIVLIVAVGAIAVSLAAGYVALAAFFAGRLVMALAVVSGLIVADAFIDAIFTELIAGDNERARAAAALLGVSRRGLDLLATLFSGVTRLTLAILAILAVLGPWGAFTDDVFAALAEAAFGLNIAGVTVSLHALFGAIAILVIGVLAVRGAQRWLSMSFLPRTALDPGLQHSISALFGYAGLIAVLSLVLGAFGIDLQKIALIAGALSVGIGFGLQSIVSNFVSGLILLAERPIRVGDFVNVKNEEGIVRRISVRATEIETFERASVIIPNSEFITGVVKNWTHANTLCRITVKVRVAFGSDVSKVRNALLGCALDNPKVLRSPAPVVYLMAFGDIGLDFELRCILAHVDDTLTVRSDLHVAVLQRFCETGIRIPQPAHDEVVPGIAPLKQSA